MSEPATPRPSLRRRLVLMLAPLIVLVAVAEGALRLADVGAAAPEQHVGRGFDAGVHYFVPDPTTPGAWRTRFFDEPEREEVIPPRSDKRRVFLFGGSNTRGFPEDVLQELLMDGVPADDPGWEVVNLGREGYGSRRVRTLFLQALHFDPDVVVIYSGHNEFIELGFLRELDRGWGSGGLRRLADAFSELRLFRMAVEGLRQEEIGPPPIDRATRKDRDIPWEETLVVYDAYRENLGTMVTAALEQGVEVVLSTCVSNMVWTPWSSRPSRELAPAEAERLESLYAAGFRAIPARFKETLHPPLRVRGTDWRGGDGVPGREPPVLRPLDGPLAATPPTPGRVRSVAGAHWTNPSVWKPVVFDLLDGYARIIERDVTEAERAELEEGVRSLREARRILPDDPRVLFDLALSLWLLGQDDEAVATFRAAAAHDRSPNSANDRTNGIVREIARAHPEVHLVDAEALFAARCPSGLVGFEVMTDGCHLQPGCRNVLMEDFAAVIRELDVR